MEGKLGYMISPSDCCEHLGYYRAVDVKEPTHQPYYKILDKSSVSRHPIHAEIKASSCRDQKTFRKSSKHWKNEIIKAKMSLYS